MRTFVVTVGAIVGFVLMPAAAGAQSAKPVDQAHLAGW